jgi:hypothetical protein
VLHYGLKWYNILALIAAYSIFEEFTLNFSSFSRYDGIFDIACYIAHYFFIHTIGPRIRNLLIRKTNTLLSVCLGDEVQFASSSFESKHDIANAT